MAKYAGGNYLILGFDIYGTKISSKISETQNLIGSQEIGRAMVEAGECASFAVVRVLHNSIESLSNARWMTKV